METINEPSLYDWLEILIKDYDVLENHKAVCLDSNLPGCTCNICSTGKKVSHVPKVELDDFFQEYNLGNRCNIEKLNYYLKDINYIAKTCLEVKIDASEVEISKL